MNKGRFGIHGGQFIPETLMNAVMDLEEAYNRYRQDPDFVAELDGLLREYAGRPSLLYYAEKMTRDLGGAKIYLKREDLNHTGSHKLNNVLGQGAAGPNVWERPGSLRKPAPGSTEWPPPPPPRSWGWNVKFLWASRYRRQALNVYRMELLGAKVHAVESGTGTLKDAVNETMREWATRMDDTHYVLGSVMGPHPFPTIVRDFQSVIGREVRAQLLEKEGRLPDALLACVGGGSNAIGLFYEFIGDPSVRLIGCEAAAAVWIPTRTPPPCATAPGNLPRHEILFLPE